MGIFGDSQYIIGKFVFEDSFEIGFDIVHHYIIISSILMKRKLSQMFIGFYRLLDSF